MTKLLSAALATTIPIVSVPPRWVFGNLRGCHGAMGPWRHGQSGNKFLEDLEGYNEQVDRLSECGNLRQVDEHLALRHPLNKSLL